MKRGRKPSPPMPCVECGTPIAGQPLANWKCKAKTSVVMDGPFCCPACSAIRTKIYPTRREMKMAWGYRRRDQGLCIECGGKHSRGTYRCAACTRKNGGRNYKTKLYRKHNRCGVCREVGHNRGTCEGAAGR